METREEQAHREAGRTEVHPGVALALCAVFLAVIAVVPIAQAVCDVVSPDRGVRRLRFGNIALIAPAIRDRFSETQGSIFAKTIAANDRLIAGLREYETELETGGWLLEISRPAVQWVLTVGLRSGNEQVAVGRDGWLYYAPDLDHVTRPGFDRTGPRQAIVDFHRQLAGRNMVLIVLPVPVKPSLRGEFLTRTGDSFTEPVFNSSWPELKRDLEESGVLVWDPARTLKDAPGTRYLRADTHWTFEAMEHVAARLTNFLKDRGLVSVRGERLPMRGRSFAGFGDTAELLRLPSPPVRREPVVVNRVVRPNEPAWTPDENADVLLLGDSFTNIYSQPELGWGDSAGLAEQLSREFGKSIDRIAINDNGRFATRQELARQIASGRDRLAGKRVVIWQFSMREFSKPDWPLIPLPAPSNVQEAPGAIVTARVKDAAKMPAPGSTPYAECLRGLHLVDVRVMQGEVPKEITAYVWGMRKNRWTDAGRLQPGTTLRLRLTPWSAKEQQLGRIARAELDDPDLRLIELPAYWAEPIDER